MVRSTTLPFQSFFGNQAFKPIRNKGLPVHTSLCKSKASRSIVLILAGIAVFVLPCGLPAAAHEKGERLLKSLLSAEPYLSLGSVQISAGALEGGAGVREVFLYTI